MLLFTVSENVYGAEAIQLTDGRMAIQIPAGNWHTIETLWTAFAIPAFVDQQKITEMVASLDWRPAPLLSGTN
jgi:hypothetical protein